MAKNHDVDVAKLRSAIRASRLALQPYREDRLRAVKQYAGAHYGDGAARKEVPVNLIASYVQTVLRSLVAKNPRVMLATHKKDAKPVVSAMESWVNRQLKKMKFAGTLRRAATDALFCIGIVKVALSTPSDAQSSGWGLPAGSAFAQCIDLDDFVFDIHAKDFSQAAFIGHRFRAPYESVRTAPYFKAKARKSVTATEDRQFNEAGDERIAMLGQGDIGRDDEFEEWVDLWEIYLPRKRCVLTITYDEQDDDHVLEYTDWLGPDHGPYHFLSMAVVPGNAIGKAPVQDLYDLAALINNIYRKLARQTERQKEIGIVQRMAAEDGSRIVKASDGDMISVDNPAGTQVVSFGGINPNSAQFAVHARDLFSKQAGNLDLMSGGAPQSKTATQDKLLNENASLTVADMQDNTLEFTSSVIEALCWYWHHDPFSVMKTQYSVPGMPDIAIERAVTADQRAQIPWDELEVQIDPYSMQHQTPQGRAAQLNQVVQQVITPLMPVLMQQGVMFDVNAFLAKLAKLMDMPDLQEIITIMPPPVTEGGGAGEAPGMPAQTERTYTRRSTGGDTPQGRENEMMNMMSEGAASGPSMNGQAGY